MELLIVEQTDTYAQILEKILSELGAHCTSATTGQEAIARASSTAYDAILTSMHLSDMSGIQLTAMFRELNEYAHCPVLLITSELNDAVRSKCIKSGVTEIFDNKDINGLASGLRLFLNNLEHSSGAHFAGARILYIEDSEAEAEVTKAMLSSLSLDITHMTSAEPALELLQQDKIQPAFDLIITDIILPGNMTGMVLSREIRLLGNQYRHIPILALTGYDDASRRIELFKIGINDYVAKPVIEDELIARVTNILSNKKLLDENTRQREAMYTLAMTDQLTGCSNRHALNEFAPKYISLSQRQQKPLSLVMLDIDYFKIINDTHGHDIGDQVIKCVGQFLLDALRKEDFVARVGGEEFLVLMTQCDSPSAALKAEAIRQAIENLNPAEVSITMSLGVTTLLPGEQSDYDLLYKRADDNLYQSKNNGRNQVTVA